MLRHLVHRAALVGLVGSSLVALAPMAGAVAAPAACATTQARAADAAAMARRCGRAVEDLSKRTGSSALAHNPDGTQSLTEYAQPHWVRNPDGSWGDVDTSLRVAGGQVVPVRTPLTVAFSAGGSAPMASIADGQYELAVSWPGALPSPTLSGDSATYPEVLPGVDLRLTATVSGFTEVLVVKNRAAAANPALASVHFGLAAKGLTLVGLATGEAQARNARGDVVFSSPTPLMWDSADGDVVGAGSVGAGPVAKSSAAGSMGAGSGGATRVMPRMAAMAESVSQSQLAVVPDRAMLADPTVTFPLYIDPQWNGGISGNLWKNVASRSDVVNSTSFTLVNGSTKGDAGSGHICDTLSGTTCTSTAYNVRSLFRMDTSGASGKHVLRATFNITQKWSFTCNPGSNAELWIAPTVTSGTTWNNQGTWDSGHTAQTPGNHRTDAASSCSGTGNDAFDATGMVLFAQSQGWGDITLGLRAVSETVLGQWKRFDAASASLAIVFNSYPNTPDTTSTAGQAGCVTGSGRPLVAVGNPVLSARVTDPDGSGEGDIGGVLQGNFGWERWDAPTSTWVTLGAALGTPQAGGTTSPSPAPTFGTGVYRWHVRAEDSWSLGGVGSGTDVSVYTGWCEFEVDVTAPAPATVTADAGNAPFSVGKTVRLTLSPGGTPADNDITGYSWWVVDGGGTHATAFVSGATAVVDWTASVGQGTVHVQAKDRIQLGPEQTYTFNAQALDTEVAHWLLADPAGSPTAFDLSGNGHDAAATLTGSSRFGAPGRIVNGATSLAVDGSAASRVDSTGPVLDTSKSFTVAVSASVASKATNAVIASQSGGVHVPFTLGYVTGAGEDRWEFVSYDPSGAVTARARSTLSPVLGVFTDLTAVYDSGAGTISLYVNGVNQGSATGVHLWSGTGSFQIGHGVGEVFNGNIADLRVFGRTVSPTEATGYADPTDPANVSIDNVGQWLVEPESCLGDPAVICQDSSGYAHDLNLTGGVTTTTAGQVGSGLLYAGTDGVATTIDPNTGGDGPVLRTDQSFTVSAWVKLATLPTTDTFTAVGQSGVAVSGFYLGTYISSGPPTAAHWAFKMKDTDAATGAGWARASATADLTSADVGTWNHLIGVYDATAQTLSLYVNGTLVATTTRSAAPWNATGALTIGAAEFTPSGGATGIVDHWNGTVDTVYAYAGAAPASAIAANRIP